MNKSPVYIVAEMACAHDGSAEHATKIVEAAASAGADGVQFQIWSTADVVAPSHPAMARLASLEIPRERWAELFYRTRRRTPQLDLWACVYDTEALSFCRELGFDGYKIHASELCNEALLLGVAASGRPVHLCVSGATSLEIVNGVEKLRGSTGPLTLLHGIQSFPTRVEDSRVRYLETLAVAFGLPVGFQDHSAGDSAEAFWLPAAAMGAGARVLEKHITDDRSRRGADYESALDPEGFTRFVAMVRSLEIALAPSPFRALTPQEEKYRTLGRRVWLTRRALEKGQVVEWSDLTLLKHPEPGVGADGVNLLLGKKCRRPLAAHEILRVEDLQ